MATILNPTQSLINYLKTKTITELVDDFNNYEGEDDPILGELCEEAGNQ